MFRRYIRKRTSKGMNKKTANLTESLVGLYFATVSTPVTPHGFEYGRVILSQKNKPRETPRTNTASRSKNFIFLPCFMRLHYIAAL
jgi:hypothetical protein